MVILSIFGCSRQEPLPVAQSAGDAATPTTSPATSTPSKVETARTEALLVNPEFEKAQIAPVDRPEPKLSREQAIANIEKLGGRVEFVKNSKDQQIYIIRLEKKPVHRRRPSESRTAE